MKIEELDVTPVVIRHLHGGGVRTTEQLLKMSREEVLSMHGMGPGVMARLEKALEKEGLGLK